MRCFHPSLLRDADGVLDKPGPNTRHADAEMAEAFHALTPGRQRSYVIHLNSAKQSATRTRRIATCRDKMLAGKGFNER